LGHAGKGLSSVDLPSASMRLFGGAQFHRAMAEFKHAAGQIQVRRTLPVQPRPTLNLTLSESHPLSPQSPEVTREQIANACGVDDMHDGVNYMRAACVIAVTRSMEVFEPLMHQVNLT
jgi:hypothetical protein